MDFTSPSVLRWGMFNHSDLRGPWEESSVLDDYYFYLTVGGEVWVKESKYVTEKVDKEDKDDN